MGLDGIPGLRRQTGAQTERSAAQFRRQQELLIGVGLPRFAAGCVKIGGTTGYLARKTDVSMKAIVREIGKRGVSQIPVARIAEEAIPRKRVRHHLIAERREVTGNRKSGLESRRWRHIELIIRWRRRVVQFSLQAIRRSQRGEESKRTRAADVKARIRLLLARREIRPARRN